MLRSAVVGLTPSQERSLCERFWNSAPRLNADKNHAPHLSRFFAVGTAAPTVIDRAIPDKCRTRSYVPQRTVEVFIRCRMPPAQIRTGTL